MRTRTRSLATFGPRTGGRLEEAYALFVEFAQKWTEFDMKLEAANCYLGAARIATEVGENPSGHAASARSRYEALGARLRLEQLAALESQI